MQKATVAPRSAVLRATAASVAVAGALMSLNAHAVVSVKGVLSGTYFTAPVISDSPATAQPSSTAPSVYAGAKVCFDLNNNGVCDATEPSTTTKADGTFALATKSAAPLVAEISTTATNGGHAVTQRLVLRAAADQVAAAVTSPILPANVAVTPLTTEIVRMMEDGGNTYGDMQHSLANRIGVSTAEVVSDINKLAGASQTTAVKESVVLTNRFGFAAKLVDRGDASGIPAAHQAAMNVEGIPRYDHIFIVMLENKATLSVKTLGYTPNINAYLAANNQFSSYFATGNPSEPNYTALGGADDFGITDDNQWNCGATGANAVQDAVIPTNTVAGLASSPFTNPCAQATNHNIVGHPNLFNAMSFAGMTWRTYSESMNPGQDFRTDSVADASVTALDYIYPPGTVNNNATAVGTANLQLTVPAGLYKTKHHPGMAYQNVRSAPEFNSSNRTLGGGQFDAAMLASSTKYAIPAGYDVDQFSTDLANGNIGNLNFVVPDQCDDMHGVTLNGKVNGTGPTVTASDCGSVANNYSGSGNGTILTRGDNYVKYLVNKIQSSPAWLNTDKRVALVLMFDEGNATSGFNSCCGWNPSNSTVAKPLKQNPDGTFSPDTSVAGYTSGNRGHGNSIFAVLTNQPNAPKGVSDGDAYSHFSFVRTLQDMFQLADPKVDGSYMNRSKYTESFIAANILSLPEYAGSADTHFDSVRPMNHAYVFPGGFVHKQSADMTAGEQLTGPDATQTNVWALK